MVVYLHYAQAIGMERLALLMNELFYRPSARDAEGYHPEAISL
jgi:hypothetical protein